MSTRLRRDLRLIRRITALNFRARLEYRAEFMMMVAIGAIWQISVLVFASVLLVRFPGLGGWSSGAVLLIASMRLLSHGLQVLLLGRVTWLTILVQEGQLDAFLLRPLPVYRQVQLAFFPVNAIGDLLVAVSLFIGALWRVDVDWTPAKVVYLVSAILGGMLIEASIMTALSASAMHAPATTYWSMWMEDLLATFGNYPLHILPKLVQVVFIGILPIAFIAYFPAGVLTGHAHGMGVPAALAIAAPLVGLLAFVASRLLWNWSLRHYKGLGGT
jgi:ABC-2 type transport system permease protein